MLLPLQGRRIAYDLVGPDAAPTVCITHSLASDGGSWAEQVPALLLAGLCVLRLDMRGHGGSDPVQGDYTMRALADDVAHALEALAIPRVHYIGLSIGGMIGQAFALAHPRRLGRLVLANTTSSYGPEGPKMWEARAKAVEEGGMAAITELAMTRYFSDAFRAAHPEMVERVRRQFLSTDPAGYIGCCDAIRDLDFEPRLAAIGARTLVIAGGKDVGTPVAMSARIAPGIRGAELAVIADAAPPSAAETPREVHAPVTRCLAS